MGKEAGKKHRLWIKESYIAQDVTNDSLKSPVERIEGTVARKAQKVYGGKLENALKIRSALTPFIIVKADIYWVLTLCQTLQ